MDRELYDDRFYTPSAATMAEAGYVVEAAPLEKDGWVMFTGDGGVLEGSYDSEVEAWDAAVEHYIDALPEWCDRCGDQAVCPDCVGG